MIREIFPFWDPLVLWWLPPLALALDFLAGDPPSWPHPVRCIGMLLDRIEPPLRKLPPFFGGMAGLALTLEATALVTALPFLLPRILAMAAAVYLAFAGLALGQLLREGRRAKTLLEDGKLAEARLAVGALVSRDVSNAGGPELARVLAESLSENFNDGFVAPYFWLLVGGPVGMWLYKAVSTMDSMWGYPHEPWTLFGRTAAYADDILAFVPARLAAFFLWCADRPGKLSGARRAGQGEGSWPGYHRFREQALSMKSPNAGWPMAMAAWLRGGSMGGAAVYNGKTVMKPELGPPGLLWTPASLSALLRHLAAAASLAALSLSILFAGLRWALS